jgi:hypothetical protein
MDCRTARKLLDFAHPGQAELEKDDQAALDSHLAVCTECDALARAERLLDQRLAAAMREVPVPQGLHSRLRQRLAQERDAYYRRWLMRAARVAAAAVLLVSVVYAGFSLRPHKLPALNLDTVESEVKLPYVSPEDRGDVAGWLGKHCFPESAAPTEFNYSYLRARTLVRVQGKQVPRLFFVRVDPETHAVQFAQVDILPGGKNGVFDLSALEKEYFSQSGSEFKFALLRPHTDVAYAIVYAGDLDRLKVKPRGR